MTNIRKQAEDEARLIIQYYHDTGHIDDLADALEVKMREIEKERSLSDSLAELLENGIADCAYCGMDDFKHEEHCKVLIALKTYKQARGE